MRKEKSLKNEKVWIYRSCEYIEQLRRKRIVLSIPYCSNSIVSILTYCIYSCFSLFLIIWTRTTSIFGTQILTEMASSWFKLSHFIILFIFFLAVLLERFSSTISTFFSPILNIISCLFISRLINPVSIFLSSSFGHWRLINLIIHTRINLRWIVSILIHMFTVLQFAVPQRILCVLTFRWKYRRMLEWHLFRTNIRSAIWFHSFFWLSFLIIREILEVWEFSSLVIFIHFWLQK